MEPDAIIEVRFKTPDEGGRKNAIIGNHYSCPLFIDGEGFDCRLILEGRKIVLGAWYRLPVKFLNLNLVAPRLLTGKSITLWEGKPVAAGKIVEVLPS